MRGWWSRVAVGLGAGALNGVMVVGLGVHPFIITLGSMWILRGIAFVASKAESILLPEALTRFAKAPLGLGNALYPVPMLAMLVVSAWAPCTCSERSWGGTCSPSAGTPRRAGFRACGWGASRSASTCSRG